MPHWPLIVSLTKREIQQRYLSSVAGLLWVLLIPLAQLAIYAFVFVEIFKAKVPGAEGLTGYVPYLAVAFWAWNAFAESLNRATPAIVENRGLIGKVAMPHEVLVISASLASLLLNFAGQLVVMLALVVSGVDFAWTYLPVFLYLWLLLAVFSLAFSYFLSATQVFIRDLSHALGPILMLWFFSTPILYSLDLVPELYRDWMILNPFNYFVDALRESILFGRWQPGLDDVGALVLTVGLLFACRTYFKRLSGSFEDYL